MIEDLYSEVVMFHYKNSPYKGALKDSTDQSDGVNPSCGDEIHFTFIIDNGLIKDLKFDGHGCAISIASASIMAETIIGKTLEEAEKTLKEVLKMFRGEDFNPQSIGDTIAFENLKQFPMRIKCATLSWHTLETTLNKKTGD